VLEIFPPPLPPPVCCKQPDTWIIMIGEADLRANARYPLACSESRASIIIMCVRSLYGLRLQPCCDLTRRKDSAARPGQPSQRRDRRLMRHKCGDNQRVSQLTHAAAWNPVNARLTSWRFVINDDCLSLLFLSIYPCLPLSLSLSLFLDIAAFYLSSVDVSLAFQYFANRNNFLIPWVMLKVRNDFAHFL